MLTSGRAAMGLALAAVLPSRAAAEPALPDATEVAAPIIVVTGTRIAAPPVTGASPSRSVGQDDLLLTGPASLEATLNQLPQLSPSYTSTSNNPGTGAATLDLRGLGSFRTLVLVNGRRWIASNAAAAPEVDVSTIPTALIERVDVVSGGGSAVYGSEAVSGVVNVVLRRDLSGVWLDARQSLTARGDAHVAQLDLTGGVRFAGDRGRLAVSLGWLDRAPVAQADRALSRVALADGCGVTGTRGETGASAPAANLARNCSGPGETFALVAQGSTNIPGGLIRTVPFLIGPGNMLTATLPPGRALQFAPDGSPRLFNVATDSYNFSAESYLQVPLTRWSGTLLGSMDVAPAFAPYLEATLVRNVSTQQLASAPVALGQAGTSTPVAQLNLDNPFITADLRRTLDLNLGVDRNGARGLIAGRVNPAYLGDADNIVTLNTILRRVTEGGARRLVNTRDSWRALIGARGDLGGSWSYDAYASRTRTIARTDIANGVSLQRFQQAILAVRDPLTGQVRCLDPANGCAPANIFGAGNISQAAVAFVAVDARNRTTVDETTFEGTVQGPLAAVGDAAVRVLAGAVYRRTDYAYVPDRRLFGNDLASVTTVGAPAAGFTRMAELYAEMQVPLLRRRRLAEELGAELGIRWSDYRQGGSAWTAKALAVWAPHPAIRLRGGWQRAVRAPDVLELYQAQTVSLANLSSDPCAASTGIVGAPAVAAACVRNGVPAAAIGRYEYFGGATARTGGPGQLLPEIGDSWTGGITVRAGTSATLAVDIYDIRLRRTIGPFGGGATLAAYGCIAGGGDPANPLCRSYTRGADGSLTFFNQINANNGELRARGIDWQLRLGQLLGAGLSATLDLSGTRALDLTYRPNASLPPIACAGRFGVACAGTIANTAFPRWRLYNTLAIGSEAIGVTLRHRWFSATVDGRPGLNRTLGLPDITARLPPEGLTLHGRHYLDLAVRLNAGPRHVFTIGVNNLTDAHPSITGTGQVQANTDPLLYDVIGRRYFVDLSVRL